MQKEDKQEKVACIIAIIFFGLGALVGIVLFCDGLHDYFISPTENLTEIYENPKVGKCYKGTILVASQEYFQLGSTHSYTVNFLPIFSKTTYDSYYLFYEPTFEHAMLICAPEGWDDGFENSLVNYVSIPVQGILQSSNSEIVKGMTKVVSDFKELGINLETTVYLNTLYKQEAVSLIIYGILFLLLFAGLMVILILLLKKKR